MPVPLFVLVSHLLASLFSVETAGAIANLVVSFGVAPTLYLAALARAFHQSSRLIRRSAEG
jgi:hypothetical protein